MKQLANQVDFKANRVVQSAIYTMLVVTRDVLSFCCDAVFCALNVNRFVIDCKGAAKRQSVCRRLD